MASLYLSADEMMNKQARGTIKDSYYRSKVLLRENRFSLILLPLMYKYLQSDWSRRVQNGPYCTLGLKKN